MNEACDCSPEFCRDHDTSYNVHVGEVCVHLNGFEHKINVSNKDLN